MNTRLSKLKTLLKNQSLSAALISSIPNIIYLTGLSHFSSEEREAYLLITPQNNYIFTDPRYSHAVKAHLIYPPRATPHHPFWSLQEINHQNSFTELLKKIIQNEKIQTIGIETRNLTVHEHQKLSLLLGEGKFQPFDPSSLRLIKDKTEIKKIQKACQLGDQAFSYIKTQIRPGITEKQLAFELEHFIRKHDATPSFPTIVAFEENATIPHHKTSDRKLWSDDLILLDFGVKYQEYCSDMTRTILPKNPTPKKTKAYQTVLTSQQKAIDYITIALSSPAPSLSSPRRRGSSATLAKKTSNLEPPSSASQADEIARQHILSQGYPSIPHALGHGIGLQVHEPPTLSAKSQDTLTEGMVFSIEPGIYLPDKFGIRIEDLFAIQNGKLVQLTLADK